MSAEEESKAQEGQAPKPDAMEMQALQAVLNSRDAKRAAKEKYAFWETQPVAQFKEMAVEVSLFVLHMHVHRRRRRESSQTGLAPTATYAMRNRLTAGRLTRPRRWQR